MSYEIFCCLGFIGIDHEWRLEPPWAVDRDMFAVNHYSSPAKLKSSGRVSPQNSKYHACNTRRRNKPETKAHTNSFSNRFVNEAIGLTNEGTWNLQTIQVTVLVVTRQAGRRFLVERLIGQLQTTWIYWTGVHSGTVLDSYSGGARFKSRPKHRLCWLRFFIVYLSPSRHTPGEYLI
jgi:hypothetical protein